VKKKNLRLGGQRSACCQNRPHTLIENRLPHTRVFSTETWFARVAPSNPIRNAARSNFRLASAKRPSLNNKSPRTAGSKWYA